jgi:predicted TPR repeat methyltransferase
MNPKIKKILAQTLEGKHFKVAVDLGCGEGYYSDAIKPHVDYLIGVDHNLPRLSVAKRFGHYDLLIHMDMRDYTPTPEVEAAFLFDSIEHIDKTSGTQLLHKLLNSNITFIFITTPLTFARGAGLRNHHQSLWTIEELESYGFQCQIITNSFPGGLIFPYEIVAVWERKS